MLSWLLLGATAEVRVVGACFTLAAESAQAPKWKGGFWLESEFAVAAEGGFWLESCCQHCFMRRALKQLSEAPRCSEGVPVARFFVAGEVQRQSFNRAGKWLAHSGGVGTGPGTSRCAQVCSKLATSGALQEYTSSELAAQGCPNSWLKPGRDDLLVPILTGFKKTTETET